MIFERISWHLLVGVSLQEILQDLPGALIELYGTVTREGFLQNMPNYALFP